MRLIITFCEDRAKKDGYNCEKDLKKLGKQLKSGKLTTSCIHDKGYNKFLNLDVKLRVIIDHEKAEQDKYREGLKREVSSTPDSTKNRCWKTMAIYGRSKTPSGLQKPKRPVYHYQQCRIKVYTCLNFAAYKFYKELERQLKEKRSDISSEKVI